MEDLTEKFERATARFSSLVHQIGDDQWSNPTPCTEWDVRALVNHLTYEARWVAPLLEGKTIEDVGDKFDGDLLGDSPKASYDDALAGATAAVEQPGALEQTVHLSFGDTPAEEYLAQLTSDFLVHSWDLARGIDADDRLDADLVVWVDGMARPQAEMLAASGLFGQPVDVPDDADAETKLLALFGRRR